jgi:chorismate mutase
MSKAVVEAVELLVDALTPAEKLRIFHKVEPVTRRERVESLLRRVRTRAAKHPLSDHELQRLCDDVRQELYEERTRGRP